MRTLYGMLLQTIICLTGPVIAPVLAANVESRIDSITIYPGHMAEIERIASIDLKTGQGDLVFAGLPSSIVEGSIRVAVTDGAAIIGGVETTREPVGEPPRKRERKLQEAIDELTRDQQDALDRVAAANNEITFIEGLAELPKGEKAAEALTAGEGAENWASLWERIGAGSREARQRMRESEREADELQKEIDTLKQKLNQLGQSRQEVVRITVPYLTNEPGTAELRLSYRVRGPSWTPLYEARLDTATGKLILNRSARVSQATGEDWEDVKLALSTSQPVHGERPELSPWWIDLAPEVKSMQRDGKEEAMQAAPAMVTADQLARERAPAQTVNAEFAATYVIDGRVTVPAGNEPRELPIGSHDLSATIGAETMPQTDPRAWLIADTQWEGEGPLPPGVVSRFRDGAYIGEGHLQNWAPGEERTLAFGIDPRVEVSFKPTKDEAGESGWVTTQSTLVRSYSLEITNRHDRALPVTGLIRIPVAKNENINVKPDYSVKPTERNVDDDKGVHAWKFDLEPEASKTLELGYEISYPEGRDLSGI